MSTVFVRSCTEADLPTITEIYNHAVQNTTAIWNETTVSLENRVAWFQARREQGYPILVAVDDQDRVLGYASFGDWRPFEGYRFTVEHSVYVAESAQGQGAGRALLAALLDEAKALGKKVMVAGIEANNTGSIALHEKLGFESIGLMKGVGFKFDRFLDLLWMQKTL
jgi:L-amino acid N-acyltransferase YncA